MPRPPPKHEDRVFRPPRLRPPISPDRIARPAGKPRRRKWLLPTLLLSIVLAAELGLSLSSGIWPSVLLQKTTYALQNIRHKLERSDAAGRPYLTVKETKGSKDQPLQVGITLENSHGGETIVLSGFHEGTTLSAGSALAKTRWSLPGNDLDKAFISAPEKFDGVMEITVTLYSSRQDVLETKRTRFSWGGLGKGDKLRVTSPPVQNLRYEHRVRRD